LYLYEESLCPKFILYKNKKRISITMQICRCSCVSVTANAVSLLVTLELV